MKISQTDKLFLLLGLFIASLLTANFVGSKLTAFDTPSFIYWPLNILFWPLLFIINAVAAPFTSNELFTNPFIAYDFFNTVHVSVGILTVPVMFLVTDIVTEVFGKAMGKKFIFIGVAVMLFTLLVTFLSVILPADPARQNFSAEAYNNIFGVTLRIMVASITAFLFAQMHDVWAFHFWKDKTKGKFLWLRNNLSTFVSQFIDSTVFMFVAFYGISPRFTVAFTFGLIIPYWIFKILFALLDTPLVYLGVRWLKENADAKDSKLV